MKNVQLFLSLHKAMVMLCLLGALIQARAASIDDITLELSESGTAYAVVECDPSASGSLAIPDTFNGLPVTHIASEAFSYCASLTFVTLPGTVTTIGEYAFAWCDSLASVTIPDGVTTIGDFAFYSSDSLMSVMLPQSVSNIGVGVFSGCSLLTSIDVALANAHYASQDGVLFNKGLTSLIQAPGAITGEYTIPDSVTSVGDYTFYKCDSLTRVIIGNSVTSIGERAFSYCDSLTHVTMGNSVRSIGDWAFSSCGLLASVELPDSVTRIGSQSFSWCTSLASVTIGNSLTDIGDWAFYKCELLTDVTLPQSITNIGNYAFSSCDALTSVTFEGDEPNSFEYRVFHTYGSEYLPIPSLTLYYYEGAMAFTAPEWQGYSSGMLPASSHPMYDADFDGLPDRLEVLLGTASNDPNDRFKTWLSYAGGGMQLHYGPHSDAVTFTVRGSSDLTLPISQWPVIDTLAFSGDASEQVASLPQEGNTRMFYLIQLGESLE